jgi:3-deoxy-D-manno-octulosonic-acid transferase
MGRAYAGFTHVCAQTDTDAQRYRQIGVVDAQLSVTGNLKFDMRIPAEQVAQGERIKQLLNGRAVAMLASSREGEEQLWLDAYVQQAPDATQWWIVPRHPQRFDEVAQLLRAAGKKILRKSTLDGLSAEQQTAELHTAQIVLGDTMGEMFAYYAIADVVLMGGTWLPFGGQNFLEPMALGKQVWVGTNIYNFEQIGMDALSSGVLWQAQSLMAALQHINQTEQHALYTQAQIQTFVHQRCGAVQRLSALLFCA